MERRCPGLRSRRGGGGRRTHPQKPNETRGDLSPCRKRKEGSLSSTESPWGPPGDEVSGKESRQRDQAVACRAAKRGPGGKDAHSSGVLPVAGGRSI